MKVLKTFGERLAQLRREKSANEQRDVLAAEVVKMTGVSQPNLSRYERGVQEPRDTDDVKALAAFYKVNWIWLLHGEGEKYPPSETEEERPRPPAPTPRAVAGAGKPRPRGR